MTLDADSDAIVRRLMREHGLTLTGAVNAAIHASVVSRRDSRPFRTPTYNMGTPAIAVDRALRLAADVETEALIRKLAELE